MSTSTENYGFVQPELTDAADITETNVNWDILDYELSTKQSVLVVTLDEIDADSGRYYSDKKYDAIVEAINIGFIPVCVFTKNDVPYLLRYVNHNDYNVLFSAILETNSVALITAAIPNGTGFTEITLTELAKKSNISYGTTDLTAGTSYLKTGNLYFVYE